MKHAVTQSIFVFILAIVGLVIIADMAAIFLLTDFWSHPFRLQNKFGIIAAEVVNIVGAALILYLPALLLSRLLPSLWLKAVILLMGIPLILLYATGWSFYAAFQKFIGVYVIQTVLQDGDQLLKFISIMPSAINTPLVAACAGLVVLYCLVICGFGRFFAGIRTTFALSALVLAVLAVPMSLFWNSPPTTSFGGNGILDTRMSRILATEFELLTAKSGPFTAFISNLNNYVMQERNFATMSIDREELRPRSGDITGRVVTVSKNDPDQKQLNIVYFLVESLRPDMLEVYGGNPAVMPTVNELAKQSIVFNDVWAQSSHSNYADVATLSGQYPLRSSNIHFYPENPPYPTSMPYDVLKPSGYHTGFFSSQNEHWGQMSNYVNSEGLDFFSHVGDGIVDMAQKLSTKNVGIDLKANEESGQYLLDFGGFMYRSTETEVQRLDGETTAIGIEWLKTLPQDKKFFAYFNFQASHYPYNVLPENFERKFLTEKSELADAVRGGETAYMPLNLVRASYQDSLLYVDQNIRQVVDYLKSTGEHDRTIYVISADTSMELSNQLVGNGGDLVPEVLRVPLIMSNPIFTERKVVDFRAEQVDIMPTLLSLSGHTPHPASQGINLLEESAQQQRITYSVAQTPIAHQYSATFGDWQLIHDFDLGSNVIRYLGDGEKTHEDLDGESKAWLASKLQNWINTQLAYYANPSLHEQYYPPQYGLGKHDNVTESLLVISEGE